MSNIKPIDGLWAIIDRDGNIFINTIKWTRRESVASFIGAATMTWKETKKYGWTCQKINITFTH